MKNHDTSRPAASNSPPAQQSNFFRPKGFACLLILFSQLAFPSPRNAGSDLPALSAQRFKIDHLRSYVEFQIGFMKIKTVDGTFHEYTGTIMYVPEDVTRSSVSAAIETKSIFTGVRPRDRHLRSSDFFDVEKYPTIFFQSDGISRRDGNFELSGDLTMHGTTRRVAIPFSVTEKIDERTGRPRLHVMAETSLKRHDFGIYGNFWGDKVLSNEIRVEFNLEAVPVELHGSEMSSMMGLKSLDDALMPALQEGNVAAAARIYHTLRLNDGQAYDFSEGALLRISAKLRERGLLQEALELVRLNLEMHPKHEDSWDYLGFLQALDGKIEAAVSTYEKLLQLNRHSTKAIEMMRWLKRPLSNRIR